MSYPLDSYCMSNIFKVLKDEIDKKEYKTKHNFFHKRTQYGCIQTLQYTYKNEGITSFYKQNNSLKRTTSSSAHLFAIRGRQSFKNCSTSVIIKRKYI